MAARAQTSCSSMRKKSLGLAPPVDPRIRDIGATVHFEAPHLRDSRACRSGRRSR